ncbi:MAG: hypothetical protein ACPGVB_16240 [Chitinophagales bacterium]
MTKPQTLWRIEFAQSLFEKIKNIEGLQACFIGGSVCRNLADEYSDLELCFVWEQAIGESKRLLIHQRIGGNSTHLTHNESLQQTEESLDFNGFQIDIYHTTIHATDAIIKDVLIHHHLQFSKLIYLNVLQNAIPLCGEPILQQWKEQIKAYPNQLAKLLIEKYTQNFFRASVPVFIFRKDWTVFYSLIAGYQKNIFLVLTALNKIYFPGFKSSLEHIQSLQIKSNGIVELYEKLYELPPKEMWEELVKLKLEVLKLVEEHFGDVELEDIYKRVGEGRGWFGELPIETKP